MKKINQEKQMTQIEALKIFVKENLGREFTNAEVKRGVAEIFGEEVSIEARAFRYGVKRKGDNEKINLFFYPDRNRFICVGEDWDGDTNNI